MDTGAMPMFRTSREADPSYSSGWDPLIPFPQSSNLGPATTMASGFVNSSYSWTLENHGLESSCQKAQYPSDMGLAEMLPMLPCFGNGNFTEMVGPFGLPGRGQVPNNTTKTPKNCRTSEERIVGRPAGSKRRRGDDSFSPLNEKGPFMETSEVQEPQNDQDKKAEQEGANNQTAEQSKDASLAKENYVHVRAKRGQATNSHSLAERVRRERISERMKMLEELVPGCNKITGKALMLDEIINYVQSLQQQVVFLSMKLATVNPDLNIDIERILSKNGPHSRSSNGTVPGFSQGMNPSHHFPHSIPQGSFAGIIPSAAQLHSMPQVGWENEIHSVFQTGYVSELTDTGTHGRPRS